MKLLKLFRQILVIGLTISLTLFSIHSCTKRTVSIPFNSAFATYISAFTSGSISVGSTVRIRLTDAFAGEVNTSQPIQEKLLSFSPKIDGELYWIDNQTLEFRPSEQLPRGKVYTASLKLDKLTKVPMELSTFNFGFAVMQQHVDMSIDNIRAYDADSLQWMQISGKLITRDICESQKLPQILTATEGGLPLAVSWISDGDPRVHYFTVDSVFRSSQTEQVVIHMDASVLDSKQTDRWEQEIPALNEFKVMRCIVVQQPEQYVQILFSDPLQATQKLDGIIDLSNTYNERFTIDGNEVRIYPSYRMSGTETLNINSGVKNIKGYSTNGISVFYLDFEQIKPEVRIEDNQRVILPSTDGLVFPFQAINLSAVDVTIKRIFENNVPQFLQANDLNGDYQMRRVGRIVKQTRVNLNDDGAVDLASWNTFYLNLDEIIKTEPGAVYRVQIHFKKAYSLCHCEGEEITGSMFETSSEQTTRNNDDDYEEYYYDDYSDYDDGYYDDWNDSQYANRNNPCTQGYYRWRDPVGKNILASDIGIIAKQGLDNSMLVAVSDLRTTHPMRDVDIEILNFQQQVITKGKTDGQGFVLIDKVDGVPYLLVAKQGRQRGYLKIAGNQSLNLATFDIQGEQSQKGLKGLLYGERGVWRPGDTLFLSFLLEDEKNALPPVHPVSFELTNPRGQIVQKMVRSTNQNGFYNFTCMTTPDAPTGNYNATVRVGGAVFSKWLKIETVKPNRLKLQLDFDDKNLSAMSSDVYGTLRVKWLHGAIARNLKANISATFTSSSTVFTKFKDYEFSDPTRTFYAEENTIFDGKTDMEGNAQFKMDVDLNREAPGMLNANFSVKVFEEGGDFSVDRFSMPYAPYPHFVGIKVPKPEGQYAHSLDTGKDHKVEIVTVNSQGNPISLKNLTWKLYKVEWNWWWEYSAGDDLSNFVSSESNSPVMEGTLSTNTNGKGSFNIQVDYPEWGNYLIRVEDEEGGHAAGETVYIDWPASVSRDGRKNPDGASVLSFSLDKTTYTIGEKCTVTFPSNDKGRALISIEDGSGIIHAEWVESKKNQTNYTFITTERMTPNAYVHITLIQPHNQTENDLPIRLFGVMPLFVENPGSHLDPVITMPNKLEPEKTFEVQVSEAHGKAMSYTLAIVDEGLLDLTRFRTPNPWSHFYAREALGVSTFDLYDQVIGAFGSKLEKLLSLGGSDEINQKGKQRANRFTPVVMYAGPFTLEKGKKATHTFKMPNYVGSVRVMLVAGKDLAYGNAEKIVEVKKPLMVLASLPRVLGPDEEIKLPVTVFAMEKGIKDVTVKVETNHLFQLQEGSTKTLQFSEPGDEVINFPLRVADKTGVGTVKVTLTGGGHTARYETEIEVRSPNPHVTDVRDAVVDGGKSWNTSFDLVGMAGTNTVEIEITSMPPVDFSKRLKYLMSYPHGCLEQVTSAVFPQLYLSEVMELQDVEKVKASDNIKAGIQRISTYQLRNGGMSYWPGNPYEDDWSTTYAGHFMLEAKKRGYALPSGWEKSWLKYQKQAAQKWLAMDVKAGSYLQNENDLIQAYRLYTLALAGKAEIGAMNRLKERAGLSSAAQWRLAAAYALGGQMETAKTLTNKLNTSISPYNSIGYTYGSNWRDEAMVIETLSLLKEREKAAPLVKAMAERLSSDNWYSTQTTAYSLIALSQFALGSSGSSISYTYTYNGKTSSGKVEKLIARESLPTSSQKANKIEVKNTGNNILFVRLINTGQPKAGEEKPANNNLNVNVRYTDMGGNALNVSQIEQGTDFLAVVTVRHPGLRESYSELALTQIFPSGWEIVNNRMDVSAAVLNASQPDYQDVRDDRVYTYFGLQRNDSKTFVVKLNATYLGKYYLPATSIEAMYDRTIHARTAGQWVKVVSTKEKLAMGK